MASLAELARSLVEGHASNAERLARAALAEGIPAGEVLESGLLAGMAEVGQRFRAAQMFVPDVLASARAMNAGMAVLQPLLAASGSAQRGRVLLGTVKGDIHDIGKNLVGIMLRGAGLEVIDAGTNVSAAAFVAAIREHQPQVVGMSALLTTTMAQMPRNLEAFREAGVLEGRRVIIGGAPLNAAYAASIGAHGYAPNAMAAVPVVLELLQETRAPQPVELAR